MACYFCGRDWPFDQDTCACGAEVVVRGACSTFEEAKQAALLALETEAEGTRGKEVH